MKNVKRVLFVCTDNFTRSVTAEMCLKDFLLRTNNMDFEVASAGINAGSDISSYFTNHFDRMKLLGIDSSSFKRSQFIKEFLDCYDYIVGMGKEHNEYIKYHFGVNILLFTDICGDDNYNRLNFIYNENINFTKLLEDMVDYLYGVMPIFIKKLSCLQLK